MKAMRPALCLFCRRYNANSQDPPTCSSFPRGIPDEIWDAIVSHIDSQHGEAPFDGVIPMGWEQFDPDPDDTDVLEEEQPKRPSEWAPARRLD